MLGAAGWGERPTSDVIGAAGWGKAAARRCCLAAGCRETRARANDEQLAVGTRQVPSRTGRSLLWEGAG
jgi:hypothetical protein